MLFFPHRFTAGTAGLLSFSTTLGAVDGPAPTVVLHADADCNQRIDTDEPVLAAPWPVVAGQSLCLVARLAVPAQAAPGQPLCADDERTPGLCAQHSLVGEHLRADLALVTDGSDAALRLSKQVDKALAASGDTLTYSIAYVNQGSAALQAVRLHDRTPAWTRFVSADCGPQPAPSCSVAAMPPVGGKGAVEWRLDSPLAPAAQGSVRLTVRVQ